MTFSEKIKLIKYGLLDYDSSFTGLKTEENNIQKINKVKPLNIMIDKNKNRNEEDLDKQFNKLLNKFNNFNIYFIKYFYLINILNYLIKKLFWKSIHFTPITLNSSMLFYH